ncbi:MAG: bifunctional tRNA (5-methylaminomethyl-2-thiouridine)(34)-methyltransferase MnmD/FAD-dependent 5-carboxymethylaminomethyl-2-thiouridine(34) oxidoreductase MnmC [Alphaproteobacteria bacterium]|nr:bifunctional tRNA (5-methylaminomethyl-2-thiouridine)(34)-methyltransferase MnmD/FAD-dependent 5-carboxymethylaminomethyl-2-thiouridine(34) oxidoreductase MnmC [Alphaproteobacteria bacterium]
MTGSPENTLDTDADRDPRLEWRDGVPVSGRFGEAYFSREDGLAEARRVFLDGCSLPDAWAGRHRFTVGETGFGTGLNFLATWDLWRRHRPADGVLHYLAVEGYPIRRGTLVGVLRPFRELAPLAKALTDRYPGDQPGLHRIWFPEDGVCLTLAIGEVNAMLPRLEARADAWFLDGFAPARNPAMWSDRVLSEVARLTSGYARLAGSTSATAVRRGLEAAGFTVERRPDVGGKREAIAGVFRGPVAVSPAPWFDPPPPLPRPDRVAVIGAGIAGASLAGALARRGVPTRWFDRREGPAAEASGNPVGILMPRPTVRDTAAGALSAVALAYARAMAGASGISFGGDGVLELAVDDAAEARQAALAATGRLAPVDGQRVDASTASRIAGVALDRPGLWFRGSGWVDPRQWTQAMAGGAPLLAGTEITGLDRHGLGWRLTHARGEAEEVDAVIVATGAAMAFPAFEHLPLTPVRGQLSFPNATDASRRLRAVLVYGGYLSPMIEGRHAAGASYDREGFDLTAWPQPVRPDDHTRIRDAMPGAVRRLMEGGFGVEIEGRASLRSTTTDQLPLAGPVVDPAAFRAAYARLTIDRRRTGGSPAPYMPGLFMLTGLGSRGLVTAPLLAELVVAALLGEPWPVERRVAEAVHPSRFLLRALKRQQV